MTIAANEEALLLEFARTRDPRVLEDLVARRWDGACAFASRALGDPSLAEDATQEAFVRLVRSADRFEAGRTFRGWWTTILLNAVRSANRERRRRARRARGPVSDSVAGPRKDADRSLLGAELEAALAALPEDLGRAVRLHYLEGRTHSEVAASQGTTVATASSRIRRGVRELRRSMRRADRGVARIEMPVALLYAAYVAVAVGIALLLLVC